MTATYDLTPDEWGTTREEIKVIASGKAKKGGTITYGELVRLLTVKHLDPHGQPLARLLDEVSRSEDGAGRGMLSVVVVRQEDQMPGDGFFHLAAELGRDTADRERCWIAEIKRVYSAWA